MTSTYYNRDDYSVYPGEFIPSLSQDDIDEEFLKKDSPPPTLPPVNITELKEVFKIEIAAPGVKREDFFITAENNILSVIVLQKGCPETEKGHPRLHEFNCKCFKRHIILPENVDAGFARAEYKAGVLYLFLSKTDSPSGSAPARIIVY